MNRFLRNGVLAFLFIAAAASLSVAGEPVKKKARPVTHRIVIQVTEDDTKKWNAILGNIRNIQAELGRQGVDITVVAIGSGLQMLTEDSLAANGVIDAIRNKVGFVACGNSMKAQEIGRDQLVAGITVVQAGYVEIMRLQQQGWIYLRP